MKKLFTLVALLACFMGAKAEWVEDYKIDYSTKTGFPFYVMGYVPEWVDGVMTDFGANYRYATQADLDGDGDGKWKDGESSVGTVTIGDTEYQKVTGAGPYWHQYFVGDGVPTEIDGSYKVTAMIKASEACNLELQMGWGQWWTGTCVTATAAVGTEWAEVEWEFSGIGGTSCNIDAKPGTSTATIEWKWLKVTHNQKAQRPTTWQEWLTSDGQPVTIVGGQTIPTYMGNAEFGQWPDWSLAKDETGVNINWRGDRTGEICAWSIVRGKNIDPSQTPDEVKDPDGNVIEAGKPRPFPCDIEDDGTGNHVFVVHSTAADNQYTDWQAWDNQFFIMSPKAWKGGQVRIKFRYKAEKAAQAQTQVHHKNPSHYLIWHAIGDVDFTTEWQEFDKTIDWADDMSDGWCIAFNLNVSNKEANTFYFDDLSWETMVLEEGLFVAGSNPDEGLEYDFDEAIAFEPVDPTEETPTAFVATVGEKDAYVSQIMISTVRGNDAAFKSNTLKPSGTIANDPDEWLDYAPASVAKLNLPGSGIWKIVVDTAYKAMSFEMLEGQVKEPVDVVTNKTAIVVNGVERDWRGKDNDGNLIEEQEGTGQPWDNQFWFKANRTLGKGEVTVLKFKYKASKDARTSTQCHGAPGAYLHWGCIGDVNFTTEWQDFEQDFTVPDAADGMQTIAFNMAEIKEACDYEITDVQWYLKGDGLDEGKTWENLINAEGTSNFWVKIGAGTDPYEYDPNASGIKDVVSKNVNGSAVIYNLAGQRVSKDFKGIVVKDGRKAVLK